MSLLNTPTTELEIYQARELAWKGVRLPKSDN